MKEFVIVSIVKRVDFYIFLISDFILFAIRSHKNDSSKNLENSKNTVIRFKFSHFINQKVFNEVN